MKKFILSAVPVLLFACLHAQTATTKSPAANSGPAQTGSSTTTKTTATTVDPGYKFDVMTHDYGTIQKGGEPYCEFKLTNTSKQPLVIQEAHGSCGCTIPEYTKEPIKPGETVTIRVHYDTNRIGPFEKTVTITFVGKTDPAILHIHGIVEAPPAETPFPQPGDGNSNGGVPVNNG